MHSLQKYILSNIGIFLLCVIFFLLSSLPSFAASLPPGFNQTKIVDGMDMPVNMDFAPDGRIFVTEKGGKLRVIKNGQLLPTPFVSISVDDYFERGLLGIAFDPDFVNNRYIYIYYTRSQEPIKNRVSRFRASESNPDVVEPNSETILLDNIPSDAGNHNAGGLHFGIDGKLYISTGEGGQDSTNSQNLGTLAGKILRINKDGTVPSDNPFFGQQGKRGEIWVYGLRNPFSFAIHPTIGTLIINDVGANIWEEVNLGEKGKNYGWPECEGACNKPEFVDPIYQQYHPLMASITGATFYTGNQFPTEYKNHYFFGDYVKNFIKKLDYTNNNAVTDFAIDTPSPVDIREGADGSLYYLSIGDGALYKISFGASPTPTPSPSPEPSTNKPPTAAITSPADESLYSAGDTIHFSGTGTDDEDGMLPASAFSWKVVFHHDTHTHPFLDNIDDVKSGDFEIPRTGENSANTWYEILLTVTDSDGAEHTDSVLIAPRKADITLAGNPSGLQLTLDGQPITTPYTFESVVGFERIIGAVSPQNAFGKTYEFLSWSDNGEEIHTIRTPLSDMSYVANFQDATPVGNGLLGTYFDHDNFTGVTVQQIDPSVNFHWGQNQPVPGIVPQYYSVRWTGEIFIPSSGTYTFYTTTDDGVKLWVNNTTVIDAWHDQSAEEHSGQIFLEGGKRYPIRMDYYNAPMDGVAVLSWSGPVFSKEVIPQTRLFTNTDTTGDGLTGNYFDNLNFTGAQVTRIDPTVDFNWGIDPPITNIESDTFSVRWTGYVIPKYSELYTFSTQTDDGVRLKINDKLLIDKWYNQSATEHQDSIMLYAGVRYPVTLEYYENTWDASAKIFWQSPSQIKEIIPQERLYSW